MIRISQMKANDVEAVLAIQAASPEAAAWSRTAYEAILARPSLNRCLVAEIEDAATEPVTAGFACFRAVESEAELLNMAADCNSRLQGVLRRIEV